MFCAVTSGIAGWAYTGVDLGYYSYILSSQLPGLIAGWNNSDEANTWII